MPATSDASFTWVDRASQRAITFSYAANIALAALAWRPLSHHYDTRSNWLALAVTLGSGLWYIARTLRRIHRRRDLMIVAWLQIVAFTILARSAREGPPPDALPWTQGWAVTTICGLLLLVPWRLAWPMTLLITSLAFALRLQVAPMSISIIEAAIPLVGALIAVHAAREATDRFGKAALALRVATEHEARLHELNAGTRAREWWDRLLHDKVLGALTLTSRATTPQTLQRARELASDALDTLTTMKNVAALTRSDPGMSGGTTEAGTASGGGESDPVLADRLREIAGIHGLTLDLRVRGHGAPAAIRRAMEEAAIQVLRNVAQHSGVTEAKVTLLQSPRRLRIEIVDEGRGFDISTVDGRRHGLRASIPGHMALIGGSAQVRSTPGGGTSVVLEWRAGDLAERGASLSADQIRAWWWVSAVFSGLHLVAGIAAGGPLITGVIGWGGLMLLVGSLCAMQLRAEGVWLRFGPIVLLAAVALLIVSTPSEGISGWQLWFLGASYPGVCIPALRGRPTWSLLTGTGIALLILVSSAVRAPDLMAQAGVQAIPFLIIPGAAALYAVTLARADARLRAAQDADASTQRRLHEAEARHQVLSDRVLTLAAGTVELLEKLERGELIDAADRRSAALLEATNRDQLVAPEVLTPTLSALLYEARARGAIVHLTSVAEARSSRGRGGYAARLVEFRRLLSVALELARDGTEVTARWQPHNSFASATLNQSTDAGDEFWELDPLIG